jgi:hypothetical protein
MQPDHLVQGICYVISIYGNKTVFAMAASLLSNS